VPALNCDKTFGATSSAVSVIFSTIVSDSGYTACLHRTINVFVGVTLCIMLGRPACKCFGMHSDFFLMVECVGSRSV